VQDRAVQRRASNKEDAEARAAPGVIVGHDKRMRESYKMMGRSHARKPPS